MAVPADASWAEYGSCPSLFCGLFSTLEKLYNKFSQYKLNCSYEARKPFLPTLIDTVQFF